MNSSNMYTICMRVWEGLCLIIHGLCCLGRAFNYSMFFSFRVPPSATNPAMANLQLIQATISAHFSVLSDPTEFSQLGHFSHNGIYFLSLNHKYNCIHYKCKLHSFESVLLFIITYHSFETVLLFIITYSPKRKKKKEKSLVIINNDVGFIWQLVIGLCLSYLGLFTENPPSHKQLHHDYFITNGDKYNFLIMRMILFIEKIIILDPTISIIVF